MRQEVVVSTGMSECPLCGKRLVKKYNMNPRHVITLNGEYRVLERVLRCSNRKCPGYSMSFRSEKLQSSVISKKIFGLDVIVHIGELRYKEHKSYEEIREALEGRNIKISMGELTNLTRTFEALIKGWHSERIQEIREKLGSYVLSIDGTYSFKDETLYIFRSYQQGLVLYAATAKMGDTAHFKPLLEKVLEMYGTPMAVISDMQPAIIEAVKNAIPDVPHQYCQFHFIRNAGKFMERDYKALEAEMKKKKVESRAKEIEKRLKEAEGMDCEDAVVESEVEEVQSKMEVVGCELQKKEKFEKCRLIIHILVLLLKITVDNFPFALYYLDLYDRYRKIRRTVRHCLAVYPHDDAYISFRIKPGFNRGY